MKKGFTLIEMLVSVALFSIVMVVALGALLSLSVATRKAEGINSTVNNLSSAIDSMSRSIRTGKYYHCGNSGTLTDPQNCATVGSSPQPSFTYKDFNGSQVTYCLGDPGSNACNTDGAPACGAGTCSILRKVTLGGNDSGYVPLTSPEVNITYLGFYVEGSVGKLESPPAPTLILSSQLDSIQPKVTIVVAGTVQVTANQLTKFNLQTSITQRTFDL